MTEMPQVRSDLRRMATEAFVIVLSILLAFTIDAWWDGRGERRQERATLSSLEVDYSETVAVLDEFADTHRLRETAAIKLLEFGRRPPAQLPNGVQGWFSLIFLNYRTLNVPTGAVDSYLASGNLELIQNTRLRTLLAAWPSLVEENAENEDWEIRLVDDEMRPFLTSLTRLGGLYAAHPAGIYGNFSDTEVDEAGLRAALAHPAFSNLVTIRLAAVRVLQRELDALRSSATEILDLVRVELN